MTTTLTLTILTSSSLAALLIWLRTRKPSALYALAFKHMSQAIIITDDKARILKVNHAFTKITGYQPDEIIGKTPAILNSGIQDRHFFQFMWEHLKTKGEWQGEIWNKRKNGDIFLEGLQIRAEHPIGHPEKPRYYIGSFTDLSPQKKYQETIERLAYYDFLTQLPNRQNLERKLIQAIERHHLHHNQIAVLFIDLDNFKTLNDTFGHLIGDLLLLQVTQRIQSALANTHTVARWGGDEFVILLEFLSNDATQTTQEAQRIAHDIHHRLSSVYHLNGLEYFGSCSIGIALFEQNQNYSELLKNADNAMYQAKGAGRSCTFVFESTMQATLQRKLELENDLRQALELHQISLHFQPQVRNNQQLFGAEALMRWQHPDKGSISPDEFIPLAEQSNLIIALGDWVLHQACQCLVHWQSDPILCNITLSVNVSEKQIRQDDFVAKVLKTLNHYQINPQRLKMEITESAVMQNLQDCVTKLSALKQQQIEFAMDDFGTGYSSLSNIHALPLSQLKIDKAFVQNMNHDEHCLKLTQTIITMCGILELEVIAEGVEDAQQQQLLLEMGCTQLQGYLFSKPINRTEFENYAQNFNKNLLA